MPVTSAEPATSTSNSRASAEDVDADVAFARNCEVEFFVPEQFFEGGSFRRFLEKSGDDEKKIGKEETLDGDDDARELE